MAKQNLFKWADRLKTPATPVRILPPVLFGWSHERHHRRFRIIELE